MHGYQPPDDNNNDMGSWREILVMIRIAFEVLALPLLFLMGTLIVLLALVFALFTEPIFALIPLGIIGAGIWYLVRRDKRLQAEMEADMEHERNRYRYPPPR